MGKSKVCVNLMLAGVAYEKDEKLEFHTLTFSVEGANDWIDLTGIQISHEKDTRATNICVSQLDKKTFTIDDELSVNILFKYEFKYGTGSDKFSAIEDVRIQIESNRECDFRTITSLAHKVAELLSFAIGTPVSIKDVEVTNLNIVRKVFKVDRPLAISVFYGSQLYTSSEPTVKKHEMLFLFTQVENEFGEILSKWLTLYDSIGPALGLYFSTKSNAQRYLDGKFLAIIQALETYSRRTNNELQMSESDFRNVINLISSACPSEKVDWLNGRLFHANELTLAQRLSRLLEKVEYVLSEPGSSKQFIRKVVDTRNYFTHYDESLKNRSVKGEELWDCFSKLEAIFQVTLLNELGFDEERIKAIVNRNYRLKQKL